MWMIAANFRRTYKPSRLAWSEGWRRSVYIHQMNQVNSHNNFGHDDSTIHIVMAIIIIIINCQAQATRIGDSPERSNGGEV